MIIKYQEHTVDEMVRYFVEGFKTDRAKTGQIIRHEFLLDPVQGIVVLRLYIDDEPKVATGK